MFAARQPRFFWIGLLFYVTSFFIVGVSGIRTSSGGPAFGFDCAFITLLFSWEQAKVLLHGLPPISDLIQYFSILISGWINLFFLAFVVISMTGIRPRVGIAIRNAILLMIRSCWIVLHHEHLLPREGYFLWTIGMLFALFSANSTHSVSQEVSATSGVCP